MEVESWNCRRGSATPIWLLRVLESEFETRAEQHSEQGGKGLMRKSVSIVIIGLVLIMATVLTGFSSVRASTGYFFNGGYKTVANRGAALTIETQNPYVATGSLLFA